MEVEGQQFYCKLTNQPGAIAIENLTFRTSATQTRLVAGNKLILLTLWRLTFSVAPFYRKNDFCLPSVESVNEGCNC